MRRKAVWLGEEINGRRIDDKVESLASRRTGSIEARSMRVVREQEFSFPAVLQAVFYLMPLRISESQSVSSLLVSKASVRLSPSPWK